MNCYLCDQPLRFLPSWRGIFLNEPPEVLCGLCRSEFEKVEGSGCKVCSKKGEDLCSDCLYWEEREGKRLIQSGRSLYHYNEAMKSWLYQYKFLKDVVLAEVFAQELKTALSKEHATIVPIPLHAGKLRERSFAQVDQLLNAAGIPYHHLLEKSGETLGEKNRQERLAVGELFVSNGMAVPKQVLLVDDLYTTGTTMHHAARLLQRAGTEEIRLLTLIRA